MLPLVHNTIVRNRSNTMPSSSTRSNNSNTTSNDASTSYTNNTQYGVFQSKENSSECKKLKSGKVCMTNNGRPFLKKSLTFSSLFSPKSSRSASTNSLNQSSLVDETIASVLRSVPISEFINESNKTVSEQNLNKKSTSNYFNYQDKLCNSTIDENTLLDNLVNSSRSSSINNDLNNQLSPTVSTIDQQIPPFAPPSYTPVDRLKSNKRPILLRSQSAPSQNRLFNLDHLHSATSSLTNSSILENIQEISTDGVLTELIEEENEKMPFRNLMNHQFKCRLAHSQDTLQISSFNTRKELYERIAESFKINLDQILYCTLNTDKIDMDHLFENHIDLKDIIYVHLKGQTKEIEIEKTDNLLGLTLCDNSNGLCLIKKIKDGSVIQKIKFINVGDIVEKINNISLIGYRHIDVANMLKAIPVGEIFVIRLIEPKRRDSDEQNHSKLNKQLKNKIKKGYSTLRIRSIGPPIFEEEDQINNDMRESFNKINAIIEEYLGISDGELAQQILDIGKESTNKQQFLSAINESDLKVFNFCNEAWEEIWNSIENSRKLIS